MKFSVGVKRFTKKKIWWQSGSQSEDRGLGGWFQSSTIFLRFCVNFCFHSPTWANRQECVTVNVTVLGRADVCSMLVMLSDFCRFTLNWCKFCVTCSAVVAASGLACSPCILCWFSHFSLLSHFSIGWWRRICTQDVADETSSPQKHDCSAKSLQLPAI